MSMVNFTTSQPQPQMGDSTVARGAESGTSDSLGNIASMVSLQGENDPLKSMQTLRFIWQAAARELHPKGRVSQCLRTVAPFAHRVDILHSPKFQRANYRNLIVCGRLWECPVCAARISEQRRKVISGQLARLPYLPIMITYTLRHDRSQKLKDVLGVLLNAKKQYKQGAGWKSIKTRYGVMGDLRGLEVTHGKAGWHAHIHELALLRANLDVRSIDFSHELKTRWQMIVKRCGGDANYENGLDVTFDAADISDYVAKIGKDEFLTSSQWAIEHEVVKGVTKQAATGGRTPNQLLHDYSLSGDIRAGAIWKEYVKEFKGKKQLVPSSFAALLGEEEQPEDGTIAEEQDSDASLLAYLTLPQWRVVLQHEYRGQLLEVARHGDFPMLADFLTPLGIVLTRLDPS